MSDAKDEVVLDLPVTPEDPHVIKDDDQEVPQDQVDETGQEPDEDERDRELRTERRKASRQKREAKKARSESALLAEQVKVLMEEVRGLSRGQQQAMERTAGEVVKEADVRIAQAQAYYLEAHQKGTPHDRLKAEEALQDARFNKYLINKEIEAYQQRQTTPQPQQYTSEAIEWAKENSDWFGKGGNATDTAKAQAIDAGLTQEWTSLGLSHLLGGADYIDELDSRLSRELPHRYDGVQQSRPKPRQTVAGSGRGSTGDGDRFRMPRSVYQTLISNSKAAGLDVSDKKVHDALIANWRQRQKENADG